MTPDPAFNRVEPRQAFELLLETACSEFETLQAMLSGELKLVGSEPHNSVQARHATSAIRMTLAQSFVFNTFRAHRLCKHQAGALGLNRDERKVFIAATETLVDVRHVNEHAYERKVSSAGRKQRSRMMHDQGNSFGDETSLTIDQWRVLMGPLDLRDVYQQSTECVRLPVSGCWAMETEAIRRLVELGLKSGKR